MKKSLKRRLDKHFSIIISVMTIITCLIILFLAIIGFRTIYINHKGFICYYYADAYVENMEETKIGDRDRVEKRIFPEMSFSNCLKIWNYNVEQLVKDPEMYKKAKFLYEQKQAEEDKLLRELDKSFDKRKIK